MAIPGVTILLVLWIFFGVEVAVEVSMREYENRERGLARPGTWGD